MPVDRTLAKTQKNQIFGDILAFGLDPADFEWKKLLQSDQRIVFSVLVHSPTAAEFTFRIYREYWSCTWLPSHASADNTHLTPSWDVVRDRVRAWLANVKADHDAPDLWAELKRGTAIPDATVRNEYQKKLTPEEVEQLRAALADVKRYVTAHAANDRKTRQLIEQRFKYLEEAAAAGPRKIDWLNVFVAQMVALVVDGVLEPERYADLMRHAAAALEVVFHFGVKLLGA